MPKKMEPKFINCVTVVFAGSGTEVEGMAISWISQMESEHLMLSVPINAKATSRLLLSKKFSVNVLGQGQEEVAKIYGGTKCKKAVNSNECAIKILKDGAPALAECCSTIFCKVISTIEIGEQVLILGKMLRIVSKDNCIPLVYEKSSYFA